MNRIALIGPEPWGEEIASYLYEMGELKVICDSSRDLLDKMSELSTDIEIIDDVDKVLSDSTIEAIVLATPMNSSFQYAKAALESGKHVFVENTLAFNSGERKELNKLACGKGLKFFSKSLRPECEAFIDAIGSADVLVESKPELDYFAHEMAVIDENAKIGAGTKIWHFSHVLSGAEIGEKCILGQNVSVAGGVRIGNNVKIQNNVSIYTGTEIEDDVFLGPSCVLTNISNPRSQIVRHSLYEKTIFRRGATIGANSTIVCGVTLGRYCFVAAGAVVTKDVPDYALMMGNPAKAKGWMSRHGHRLKDPDADGVMVCAESSWRYKEVESGVLRCLDCGEDQTLPEEFKTGDKSYRDFKSK